ncbi:MAG TPA: PQQ-dependent sugar dehydrogenase [Solirubrobacteraceae bacterium]|nr:PQQ-dependent sugar dehydrogenase [Solirubrobacteraceae bacterium]
MRSRMIALVCAVAVLAAAAVAVGALRDPLAGVDPKPPATERGRSYGFDVERVATGLNRPTWVGVAPGDPETLWVLEQPGRVVRLRGKRRETEIDLTGNVTTGAEQGLLGLAFHPDFATNRRLYLNWSDENGDTRVAEFRDGRQIRELLFVDQPEPNHNGGHLAFGPDGRLYVGMGDGGGAFDPDRRAQDPGDRLGKLLSTAVGGEPRWRVELLGLRNPWRFAFDPALGEVWIGDVGQDQVEEIDRVLLEPDEPPKNLGWSAFEGTDRVSEGDDSLTEGDLVWPVAQYTHDDGCSVTGGYVYQGTKLDKLRGRYLYGDFCSGVLWSLEGAPEGKAADVRRERAAVPQLTHIGPDADGEPLFASAAGAIYRAVRPR